MAALESMLPDFSGKRVLDLGCGYGWHLAYAVQHGAQSATGIDLSHRMLAVAREKTAGLPIEYRCMAIEDMDFAPQSFDVVLSSLALHYVCDFAGVAQQVARCLAPGGAFVFSVEHPIFTAQGAQQWVYDEAGNIAHFPVDGYFDQGPRQAVFLGERVLKYHRTLTAYLDALFGAGFALRRVVEPTPPAHMMHMPGMQDELRRPMMLLVSAQKA